MNAAWCAAQVSMMCNTHCNAPMSSGRSEILFLLKSHTSRSGNLGKMPGGIKEISLEDRSSTLRDATASA